MNDILEILISKLEICDRNKKKHRGIDMGFAERAAARRKSKDLKNELKELRGQILAAGEGEKAKLTTDLKEFGASMELGASLYTKGFSATQIN